MNETVKNEVMEAEIVEINAPKKESKFKAWKHELGRKLANDEPLVSKKTKVTVGVIGGVLTATAVCIAKFAAGEGAPELDELPEAIDSDEAPFLETDEVVETIE